MPKINDVRYTPPEIPFFPLSKGIPRTLNQIFLSGWETVPKDIRDVHLPALRARNPGWQYRFFDAAEAVNFIGTTYGPGMLAVYESIDPAYYAARADLLRYLIIYAEGGVYIDIKSDISRPLDALLEREDAFLLSQWPTDEGHRYAAAGKHPELAHLPGGEYQQWFIIAARGHPFLRAVIERVVTNVTSYRPFRDGVGATATFNMTGPIAYTLAIHPIVEQHPHRVIQALDENMLVYSLFPEKLGHREAFKNHYAYVSKPIVRRTSVVDLTATVFFTVRRKIKRLLTRLQAGG